MSVVVDGRGSASRLARPDAPMPGRANSHQQEERPGDEIPAYDHHERGLEVTITDLTDRPTDFVSQAMALNGPGPMTRTTDPTTSHLAATSLSAEAREASERFVLGVLTNRGPMTQELLCHVAEMHGEPFSPSRIRTACKQLVDKGLVRGSGIKAKTDSGRLAIEWMAV